MLELREYQQRLQLAGIRIFDAGKPRLFFLDMVSQTMVSQTIRQHVDFDHAIEQVAQNVFSKIET